jgi:hypothetical protein
MYYEHQYDRLAKHESYRLTISNYVLTISAAVFTFGYKDITRLTLITGIGLPLIIIIANAFAILYIDRTKVFISVHQDRAREILSRYAPELKAVDGIYKWPKGGFLQIEKGLHQLLILAVLIPLGIYLYQTIWK